MKVNEATVLRGDLSATVRKRGKKQTEAKQKRGLTTAASHAGARLDKASRERVVAGAGTSKPEHQITSVTIAQALKYQKPEHAL